MSRLYPPPPSRITLRDLRDTISRLTAERDEARAERDRVAAEWAEVSQRNYQRAKAAEAENERLKGYVIVFCVPWATTWAMDRGLPDGHIAATHYDILAECGARMEGFTRAALGTGEGGGSDGRPPR